MLISLFFNFKMRYNNINFLHFIFYYIKKLALLLAQQCQAPNSPNRILAQLCSCISLVRFKKIITCFSFSRLHRFLVIWGINGKFQAKRFLPFRFLLAGFYRSSVQFAFYVCPSDK